MRSLAHPAWPYVGTSHEWRGFAIKVAEDKMDRYAIGLASEPLGKIDMRPGSMNVVYQKLNFGPDLP